jgi:hypothetical protein
MISYNQLTKAEIFHWTSKKKAKMNRINILVE